MYQKAEEPNIEALAGTADEDAEEPNNEPGATAVPQGVVHEGENISRIVEQMKDEDRELHETLNKGCDDDLSDDDDVCLKTGLAAVTLVILPYIRDPPCLQIVGRTKLCRARGTTQFRSRRSC